MLVQPVHCILPGSGSSISILMSFPTQCGRPTFGERLETAMLTGSCLCGAVAYQADATIERIVHCHCQTCRKTHGTAFSSVAAVPREKFQWLRGQEYLAAIESSPGKFRRFCSRLG